MAVSSNKQICEAAKWLSRQDPRPSRVVPTLRQRFNLTAKQACEAIRLSSGVRRQEAS